MRLLVEKLEFEPDAECAFCALYGASRDAFWLDSSRRGRRGRFSFIGDAAGPLARLVSYDVASGLLRERTAAGVGERRESIFDYLAGVGQPGLDADVPFDFDCGLVGYLGYELKAECGGEACHRARLPDAGFIFADRVVAFDHDEGRAYLLALADADTEDEAEGWIERTRLRLRDLSELEPPGPAAPAAASRPEPGRSRSRYLADVAECQRLLGDGETYEVCLTDRFRAPAPADPLAAYRRLRRLNPAPFSAYLRLGEAAVLSSSPERFLAIGSDRWVEARPMKGTAPRDADPAVDARLAAELQTSPKTRAENLMICDLLRNDLGSVCEIGSVGVPELIAVESYETVHQLVSCVRGRLRGDLGPAECVRACFPPGSMTGAPKRRTMEIIDALEGEARGVYSGAIGYFGLGGGCDLSVAIRTAVVDRDSTTVGAGGAIVLDSDPEAEYEEMLLKARAPLRALASAAEPVGAPTLR